MSTNPDPDPLQYYEHELPAVIRGVRNGEKWEYRGLNGGPGWYQPTDQSMEKLMTLLGERIRIRLAPKPTLRQWTFETRPEGMVWVHPKHNPFVEDLITQWGPDGALIAGFDFVYYETLFTDWLQRDGKPCGTEEGGSK